MDQRRDGRRALHGVGQPDVQREHGALARTADEHQPQGQRNHPAGRSERRSGGREGEGPGVVAVDEDADEEAQVGEARDDEGLLRGGDRRGLRVVEADQEVGAHAHQLPEEIHLEDVRRHDQPHHAHREQRQEGVVALEAPLALHVAQRVDVDHERDGGDHHEHHHRDRVEEHAQIDVQVARDGQPDRIPRNDGREDPGSVTPGGKVFVSGRIAQHGHHGQHGRSDGPRHRGAELHAREPQKEEAHEGQQQNQNRIFHKRSQRVTTSSRAGS